MDSVFKKLTILILTTSVGYLYSATIEVIKNEPSAAVKQDVLVAELQKKERKLRDELGEYWIDTNGTVRVGTPTIGSATPQFEFSDKLMSRDVGNIKKIMNSAIARFTEDQKKEFTDEVYPLLGELDTIQKQLKAEREKLDDAATELGKMLHKTRDEIMKLPDKNITALIQAKITDGAIKIEAHQKAAQLKKLRAAFSIQTEAEESATMMPKEPASYKDEERTKSGSGVKSAIAKGIVDTNFKIPSMTGFVGAATQYGMCRDRHFDIVLDSDGLQFISEAR